MVTIRLSPKKDPFEAAFYRAILDWPVNGCAKEETAPVDWRSKILGALRVVHAIQTLKNQKGFKRINEALTDLVGDLETEPSSTWVTSSLGSTE